MSFLPANWFSQIGSRQMPDIAKPLDISRLAKEGVEIDLVLTSDIATQLAEACEVEAVNTLTGSLTVRPYRRNGISVKGAFVAQLTQNCSVTLEPLKEYVEDIIERYFLPLEDIEKNESPTLEEIEVLLETPDPPEPLIGREISLFEILREQILLSKNAFPRKEGAALESGLASDQAAEREKESPFAALKVLQGGKKP